ncbi:roadblock/LC7 domain-containing protein [Streptomyces sp. NBC_01261]|uniref:roadblock/LC7 domain-containing protein n=1 Tax=unclassified Streptomyces TaxID=2593676 RepID=UPI002E2A09CF|nr:MULTISPECIES: roadblock/LC7 domain-containing protein [unclassified Streptomyces]
MASEAEILDELRRLRARVPQLTGALATGVDGLVLAQDTPGVEPERVAALTVTALGVAVRMADATGQGDFRELIVRGVYGYVATYAAGRGAVLTVLAQDRVHVGRLLLEGRRAGARIGELVDAGAAAEAEKAETEAAVAEERTDPAPPVKAPPKTTTARTRTARAPRTTTGTNARTTTES